MIDLSLTAEQVQLQQTVRRFVAERILPVAQENDLSHSVDGNIIRGIAESGWLGATIPTSYGGLGLDFVSLAIIAEELERGDAAFRTLLSVHLALNSMTLLKFCTETQKWRYLVPQAQGTALAAFGLTEPDAGSDVAAMGSTAQRDSDGS